MTARDAVQVARMLGMPIEHYAKALLPRRFKHGYTEALPPCLKTEDEDFVAELIDAADEHVPRDFPSQQLHSLHPALHAWLLRLHILAQMGFCRVVLPAANMAAVAKQLPKVSELRDLEVRGDGCGGPDGSMTNAAGVKLCNSLKQLTRLCVSHTWHTPLKTFLAQPSAMTALQALTFEFGAFDFARTGLGDRLAQLPALTELKLHSASCSEQSYTDLMAGVARCTRMRGLRMGLNAPNPVPALAEALANMPALQALAVSVRYDCAESAASALAPVLARLRNLTGLDLSNNGFEGDKALALAPAIGKLRNLQVLQSLSVYAAGADIVLPGIDQLHFAGVMRMQCMHISSSRKCGCLSLRPAPYEFVKALLLCGEP